MKTKIVLKLIATERQKLMDKAMKSGLYENFGQTEVGKLEDKISYNPYGTPEDRLNATLVREFDNWCMNYDGR